jgi:hypothetical protein
LRRLVLGIIRKRLAIDGRQIIGARDTAQRRAHE